MNGSSWRYWLGGGALALLLMVAVVWATGKPRVSTQPLDISKNGVHGVFTLRNRYHQLLLYNFRAVEPDALYRGSGFPKNLQAPIGSHYQVQQAALADDELFNFLRAHNVHRVVRLQVLDEPVPNDYFGERDYFNGLSSKTGYSIKVIQIPVQPGHAYDRDSRALQQYPDYEEQRIGLRAAAEFIDLMKHSPPNAGAVYLHDDAGKDRVGVVAAAYELWRNQGVGDRDTVWNQIVARYLVSNKLIARDGEAGKDAGGVSACPGTDPPGYVCQSWLDGIRPELERVAGL